MGWQRKREEGRKNVLYRNEGGYAWAMRNERQLTG
jgi:hypothetical protein